MAETPAITEPPVAAEAPVVAEVPVAPETPAQVETPVAAETPTAESVQAADADFSNPSFEEKPKKSKKGKIVALISAAVAVLLAVAVVLNFTAIKGFFIKNFGSDEAYFQYVEELAFSDFADAGSSLYGSLLSSFEQADSAAEIRLDLELSEELMSFANSASGVDVDLDWLKNISCVLNAKSDDGKQDIGMKFLLGNATLLDLQCLFDMNENEMFIALPNLSDKYISLGSTLSLLQMTGTSFEIPEGMLDALPSEGEINDLLKKYLSIALDGFGDVSKDTEVIEVGDCSQEVTVLEYELTGKDVAKMLKEVLKELKNDEDVKACFDELENFIYDEYRLLLMGSGYERGDLYDMFKEGLSDAIDEIDPSEAPSETLLTLVDYVNASHEIVGREIEVGGFTLLSYMTASEGNAFAFEAKCDAIGLRITGDGTEKGDAISATYDVIAEGQKLLELELVDFVASEGSDAASGDIIISPSSDLLDQYLDSSNSAIALLDPALKLSFSGEGDTSSVAFSVLSNGSPLFSLKMSVTTDGDNSVEMPDESDAVDVDNIDEWVSSIDLNNIVDALENIGLPSELLTALENSIGDIDLNELFDSMGGFGYGDIYGDSYEDSFADIYDDYDDYYDDYYDEYFN